MRAFSDETIAYAMQKGVDPADLPLICNGCSGGLSWVYALGGRAISCVECCNRHDIDYEFGGTAADRKAADVRLWECAAVAPSRPKWQPSVVVASSWPDAVTGAVCLLRDAATYLAARAWWPVCRAWRWTRAWIMYAGVRAFGGRYWAGGSGVCTLHFGD